MNSGKPWEDMPKVDLALKWMGSLQVLARVYGDVTNEEHREQIERALADAPASLDVTIVEGENVEACSGGIYKWCGRPAFTGRAYIEPAREATQ